MIKSLHLINWQCHRDKLIEFGKITVLVGQNDAGKSSILRALLFVMLNQWDGEANSHVSWGAEFSELVLKIDKHTITRRKGPKINEYLIDNNKLVAFGPVVPEEVCGIVRADLDNFQRQHDNPYWILLNGGQAAKALNRIIDLEPIDSSRVKISRERWKETVTAKKGLSWVAAAEKDMEVLESLQQQISELATAIDLEKDRISKQEKLLARVKSLENAIKLGRQAILGYEEIEWREVEVDKLQQMLHLEDNLKSVSEKLKQKQALFKKWSEGKCPLCEK
jgi:predicted ATP-dependent endonuclease of OLD family